jgi:putative ABC transport system permease protein
MTSARRNTSGLFLKLACQNILRRPTRTLLLILAVALATGAVFAAVIVGRGVEASIDRSFAQMGADLVVVPADALVNITSALLTVQPTESTIDLALLDRIAQISGVEKVAAQSIYRIPMMVHMPEHRANLVAFDPKSDFTVLPWLKEKLPRQMRQGDLIYGARLGQGQALGEELEPCDQAAIVFGKLGRSGVGPLDDSIFATNETAQYLAQGKIRGLSAIPSFDPKRCSAILVRLSVGTTPEQVKFAISQLSGVKVITGTTIVTSTRQTTSALLAAMLGMASLVLLGSAIVIALLFSAIISERKREVGLLSAIGSRRSNIVSMLLAESCFTTGMGGLCGIALGTALLLVFQRSLVYYLETLHIEFSWSSPVEILIVALLCMLLTIICGLLGAIVPALKVTASEPYALIQLEGG